MSEKKPVKFVIVIEHHTDTGEISGTLGPIPEDRVPGEDLYPEGKGRIVVDAPAKDEAPFSCHLKRVDLKTKALKVCPVLTRRRHNDDITSALMQLNAQSIGALRKAVLRGDMAELQAFEDKAAQLESEYLPDMEHTKEN